MTADGVHLKEPPIMLKMNGIGMLFLKVMIILPTSQKTTDTKITNALMLMPQTLPSTAKIEITYSVKAPDKPPLLLMAQKKFH